MCNPAYALALLPCLAPSLGAQSEAVLQPADIEPGLRFGTSVSLSGTGLLIGAPGDEGTVPGRAYVFRSTPTGWVEEATLQVPGAAGLGEAVRLVGDLAFVGAEDYVHTSGNASGAVFLFERTGTVWGPPTLLLPSDVPTTTGFGHDLAAEPGRLIVAGATQAYVFEPVAGTWKETAVLSGSTATLWDVDLDADRAVLAHDLRAYVFEHDGTSWDSGTALDDWGMQGTNYGHFAALENDRIATLSITLPCMFPLIHGYELQEAGWRKSTLLYEAGVPSYVAEMDGGRLAITGANWLNVYRSLPSGGWVHEEMRIAGVISSTFLGGGGDISGNLAVLGAPWDDLDGVYYAGSVWVWELASLAGLPTGMSVESGGTQQLELRRGLHAAFSFYWIFGSATGTSPGSTVDGLPLPLNFDGYYLFLALNPNTVVEPTIGLLDEKGRAPAQVTFPPLDPMLVGTTLHHAYLTIDLIGGPTVDFASNAVPLRLATESDLPPEDFESLASGWDFGTGTHGATWEIVENGDCGAVTRMAALTTPPPGCGGDLSGPSIGNARLTSSPFRLGEVGDYELRLRSILTPGLSPRIRLFVDGDESAYFEVAWPFDFSDDGMLESLSFSVPGIEYAIGEEARLEFVLNGAVVGNPIGWWVDDVELVKLP